MSCRILPLSALVGRAGPAAPENRAVATVNSTTGGGGPLSDPAKRAPAGLSDLCVAAAARDKAALGLGWRPGDEGDVVEALAVAEQAARLAGGKAGELRRFQVGGDAVGPLDQSLQRLRFARRQAEAQPDRRHQTLLENFIVGSHGALEGRDEVADEIGRASCRERVCQSV